MAAIDRSDDNIRKGTMRIIRNALVAATSFALVALASSCMDNPEGPNYGILEVIVQSSGGDLDDQYTLAIDSQRRTAGPNANLALSLVPGKHTVQLLDVAGNCTVNGPASFSFDTERGRTFQVTFTVTCQATGLEVSVKTTGVDLPANYLLTVTGIGTREASINGTTSYRHLVPGSYTIELTRLIPTCTLAGSPRITVQLSAGTIAPVAFEVGCVALSRLEKIAYISDVTFSTGSTVSLLAVALPDGTGEQRLIEAASASWSPDGKQIAYTSANCSSYWYYYYYTCNPLAVIDPETSKNAVIFSNDAADAAWSPRDDMIAFVNTARTRLYMISNSNGTVASVSVPGVTQFRDPAWSPDGQMLAFGCNVDNGPSELCTAQRNGSGLTVLTSSPGLESHPAWSPDGNTIAFALSSREESEIRTIPASGGNSTFIAAGFDPSWSRGGSWLVFARAGGLFRMRPDGTEVSQLTTGKHHDPVWRP
jgi:TolB protein